MHTTKLHTLSQVEAAAEDVAASGLWTDISTLLPDALSAGDVAALLSRCVISMCECAAPALLRQRCEHV